MVQNVPRSWRLANEGIDVGERKHCYGRGSLSKKNLCCCDLAPAFSGSNPELVSHEIGIEVECGARIFICGRRNPAEIDAAAGARGRARGSASATGRVGKAVPKVPHDSWEKPCNGYFGNQGPGLSFVTAYL